MASSLEHEVVIIGGGSAEIATASKPHMKKTA